MSALNRRMYPVNSQVLEGLVVCTVRYQVDQYWGNPNPEVESGEVRGCCSTRSWGKNLDGTQATDCKVHKMSSVPGGHGKILSHFYRP